MDYNLISIFKSSGCALFIHRQVVWKLKLSINPQNREAEEQIPANFDQAQISSTAI